MAISIYSCLRDNEYIKLGTRRDYIIYRRIRFLDRLVKRVILEVIASNT